MSSELVPVVPQGAEVAADWGNLKSPESYVGYGKAENFASPGSAVVDERPAYSTPARLRLNEWALSGDWTVTHGAWFGTFAPRMTQPEG